MQTIRSLRQPGPTHASRIDAFRGDPHARHISLTPGVVRFSHGDQVDDHATEVLVRAGHIRDGIAALDLLVVDMQGHVHEGWLQRGENPVCITFDLIFEDLTIAA
jgi:hypothetical protein